MAESISELLQRNEPCGYTDLNALRERVIATGPDNNLSNDDTNVCEHLDAAVRSSHDALMERMQLYCLVLDAEGVLDGLSDYDCYLVRIAFWFDARAWCSTTSG
jgi:hypothetical protein